MSARSASRWVVVKFGGTSVSSLANWRNIALVVKRRLESGNRVLVVHWPSRRSPMGLKDCWPHQSPANPMSRSRPLKTATSS
jgi:hypothetical protein